MVRFLLYASVRKQYYQYARPMANHWSSHGRKWLATKMLVLM